MTKATVTERSYYPVLQGAISKAGGTSVSEVSYNSVPDIEFVLGGHKWLMSVKIGDTGAILKSAMLQYLRHKEESGIRFGVLLLLDESARKVDVEESALRAFIEGKQATALVDAGEIKQEIRSKSFPEILRTLRRDVLDKINRDERSYYSMDLVVGLLYQHVSDMMDELSLDQEQILRIVVDRKLFMNIAHLQPKEAEAVGRFLASYILLSQVLFLRLFYVTHTQLFSVPLIPVSKHALRAAFRCIEDINYKPIYSVDVLDVVPDNFVEDTFRLLWGLEVEKAQHELPGRIFHQLMPKDIRKMLAAFYTRPVAADLLATITIGSSGDRILDPASGSGTILVSAYKRKLALHRAEGKVGNPHQRYCEDEIFGADIMPFSVHLTEANLAALDVGTTLQRTQVIQTDSLKLVPGIAYEGGILQTDLFPPINKSDIRGSLTSGEKYVVTMENLDAVLMNPPFTKVERGISSYVDMERFKYRCGGEVGLWGHFICLADEFLRKGGRYGAVLPINVLRGRESEKVRGVLFKEWTPQYVLKTTRNYAFSEWAEYRDVLVVCSKVKPKGTERLKFCLIRKDLGKLTSFDIDSIAAGLMHKSKVRSKLYDIDTHELAKVWNRFDNMMWFCGVTEFGHRDILTKFVDQIGGELTAFPEHYFREGFRPVPKGVSQFLFITRQLSDARVQEAFLRFSRESSESVSASTPMGAPVSVEKGSLMKTLRTSIGLTTMEVGDKLDFIAFKPYRKLEAVLKACDFKRPEELDWHSYWDGVEAELLSKKTHLVVLHRINPFAPSTHLLAHFSCNAMYPSNQLNLIMEADENRAKATCVLLNSILFLSQFFMLKEESTGRYINIRFYDLQQMNLYPSDKLVRELVKVFQRFSRKEFGSLRNQLDQNFEMRYDEFWARQEGDLYQKEMFSVIDTPIKPSKVRLDFDQAVCDAVGMNIDAAKLSAIYDVLVKEMIITRHLTRD